MTIRDDINACYQAKKDADDKLHAIRTKCPHSNTFIGWWSWRIGSMLPAKICLHCDKNVGGLTEAETQAFIRAEDERKAAAIAKIMAEDK